MKNVKTLITRLKHRMVSPKATLGMDELISYPKDSMGFHLGCFLFNNSHDMDPVLGKDDIYRILITRESSDKEEIAMHFFLWGNGDISLRTLFISLTGAMFYPHYIRYFCKKFRDGKAALRFYDLDHFRMLHLPLQRIKDTFLIR